MSKTITLFNHHSFHFRNKCLLVLVLIFTARSVSWGANCNLGKPTNLTTAINACTATLTWRAVAGVSYYGVKIKLHNSFSWSHVITVGTNTTYTFTGLVPNTLYDFAAAAYCSNHLNSDFTITSGSTATCGPPIVDTLNVYDPTKVFIFWSSCSSSNNQIRYRLQNFPFWSYVQTGSVSSIDLHNLITNSTYKFQVCSCADTTGNWSPVDTFKMVPHPNILMIIVDDARFDTYSCNGAPSWFKTPNIDRIANEGINIKNTFAVFSFCVPSRGSIVTGLYPHNNGAVSNSTAIYSNLPTTAKILDSAGYYVGWVGKYHMAITPQPGYNYWVASKMNSGTSEYWNLKYDCNGVLKTIHNHDTETVTDSSIGFFNHVHHKNFFLTMAYHAPHFPMEPQPYYLGMYKNKPMPVPDDTAHYSVNYPSFLYMLGHNYSISPDSIPAQYEAYFEMMAGVDSGVGVILQKITDLGALDNTMILFMSDNGKLIGEHGFYCKLFAYDPSMRIPLFIRYPAWFAANTIDSSVNALNIDIAPTILQAAGIHTPYHFDGVSLPDLMSGKISRPQFYYEYLFNQSVKILPGIRAVRDSAYKLITYKCNQPTNEFFDLTNDPEENTNQIFNPAYASKIVFYQNLLSNLKQQYDDVWNDPVNTCSLSNQQHRSFENDDEDRYLQPALFPNPASDLITFGYFHNAITEPGILQVTNALGDLILQRSTELTNGDNEEDIDVGEFPDGVYYVRVMGAHQHLGMPFIVHH